MAIDPSKIERDARNLQASLASTNNQIATEEEKEKQLETELKNNTDKITELQRRNITVKSLLSTAKSAVARLKQQKDRVQKQLDPLWRTMKSFDPKKRF